ncbi:MAG: hypothetical protein ACJ74C_06935 [Gaiellaceae bacterium]
MASDELDRPRPVTRNWLAVAALWAGGVVWLALVGVFIYAAGFDNEVSENVGWALLGCATVAFVLALAGITAIRTRGETAVAIVALALVLALTSFGTPLLFGWGLGSFE